MATKLLKTDFHTHTAEDPEEPIRHTSCQLIDRAHLLGYDALSVTNHNGICFNSYLRDYAAERGIILIPGAEITVHGKHVLIVNAQEKFLSARTFADIKNLKNRSNLVVAPHPFFPGLASLLWHVRKNIDLFDALEYSWFFNDNINFNTFAVNVALRYNMPLVCSSDCHHLPNFGSAYSLVEAEKDTDAIIDAVKRGRVQIAATPLNLRKFTRHGVEHVVDVLYGSLRHLWNGKR